MVDLMYCLTNLLFIDIPLLYYYINLRSLIICRLFFWKYISFFRYFSIKSNFFCFICNFFWIIVWWSSSYFCSFISTFISNQITSYFCCFLNYSFWSSFKCICSRLFSMIKKFLAIFKSFLFILFSKRKKSISFYKYSISWLNWLGHQFLCFTF